MRFSAHLGYLYTELPLEDRLAAAAADGFRVIEHPEPWAMPAAAWRTRMDDLGLSFAQTSSGMGGAKGLAAVEGREAEFRAGFLTALDFAQALDCPLLHPMAGVGGNDATYRENIAWAMQRLEGTGVALLVEAITVIPGYFMNDFKKLTDLQDEMGAGLRLLFDSFHAANVGLNPAAWLGENISRLGHVHIADHPGRNEPGRGAIDFAPLLNVLKTREYSGAIGFEYLPATSTAESLAFLADWRKTYVR